MSNFVYDATPLTTTKRDQIPLAAGADPNLNMRAVDYNQLAQASLDLRGGVFSNLYLGIQPQATRPPQPTGAALQRLWVRSVDNHLLYFDGVADVDLSVGSGSGTVTSVTAGTGLTATPNPIVAAGTIDLADTAVVPGSYVGANITVDQQGRITAAANGSIASLYAASIAPTDNIIDLVLAKSGILIRNNVVPFAADPLFAVQDDTGTFSFLKVKTFEVSTESTQVIFKDSGPTLNPIFAIRDATNVTTYFNVGSGSIVVGASIDLNATTYNFGDPTNALSNLYASQIHARTGADLSLDSGSLLINFQIGGINKYFLDGTSLYPTNAGANNLGLPSNEWNFVYTDNIGTGTGQQLTLVADFGVLAFSLQASGAGAVSLWEDTSSAWAAGKLLRLDNNAVEQFAVMFDGIPKWSNSGNVQTTVGAAGGASAPPVTPTKYLKVKDDTGATLIVPAYNP